MPRRSPKKQSRTKRRSPKKSPSKRRYRMGGASQQVYVPIWTFTDGLSVESKSIGVFRDVKSAFLALIKKGIEDGYILKEIYTNNNTPEVTIDDAYKSLGGGSQKVGDVYKETSRLRLEKQAQYMELIRPFINTTEKFVSRLYEEYIAPYEGNLEEMNEGLQRLGEYCATKEFVENFKGSVCVNEFQ